jgi:LacI family transcriptional regulator
MQHRVTLKEIAEEAGLSVTAVSLVLNDRPCRLSAESKARILEIARRRNYRPNYIARTLVTRESRAFGLIVPNIESRFFAGIASNLEKRCRKEGYALFITNSNDSSENDLELMRLLVERGVDGLFLVVSNEVYDNERVLDAVGNLTVPYVMVDRVFSGHVCDQVRFDNRLGGYLATRHLIENGHERIAAILNTERSNSGRGRLAGYLEALESSGLRPDERLVIESPYTIAGGYEAAARALESDATAIFAGSDSISVGVLKRLSEKGLRVPDDYSLVSYDNSIADLVFELALTAVHQDAAELADHAFDMLAGRIRNPESAPVVEILTPKLVVKDSVRPRDAM